MFSQKPTVAFMVAVVLTPAVSFAQGVIDLIPDDAYGYVVVRNAEELDAKIGDFARRLNAPIPSVVDLVKAQTGLREGVDEKRPLAAAILPGASRPALVMFVPVDDYAALVGQLASSETEDGITSAQLSGQQVLIGEKTGYGVVVRADDRPLLEKILLADANQPAGDAAALADSHDVAAAITSSGLELFCAEALKGLQQAKDSMRQMMGEDSPALAGIDIYVHLIESIQAEVASAAIGIELEQGGGVRIRELVRFQPSGKVAPMLKDAAPYEGDLLGGLPETPYVVAFGAATPEGSMEAMMDFSGSMMKSMSQIYGMTPEQVDKMVEMSAEYFSDMRGMSFVIGVGEGDAPLYSSMMGVMQVDDAPSFLQKYREYWQELDDMVGDAEEGIFANMELEEVEVDGVAALKVTMPMENLAAFGVPDSDAFKPMIEKMYGPGGMTMYVAAGDDDSVYMAYTNTTLLSTALQAANEGTGQLSQSAGIAATAGKLPSNAYAVAYWNPSGTAAFVGRVIGLMTGGGAGLQIPPFPETPPIGSAVTVEGAAVKIDSIVPAEVIDALGDYVEQVKQMGAPQP